MGVTMIHSISVHAVQFLTATAVAVFLLCSGTQAQDKEQGADFKALFNGKDLSGWKVSENPESVVVEDGTIITHGERAHAFYVGDDGKASFTNFHLKAKVKTAKGANSGIYFHTEFQEAGWPSKGYECQVNNTQQDPKKTGGLYGVQDNFEAPVKDDVWFDYDIIVEGKHVIVKINGKTISDYTEPDDVERAESMSGRLVGSGTFALQAHDPGSKVWFKDIMVKTLP